MNKKYLISWFLSCCGTFSYAYYESRVQINLETENLESKQEESTELKTRVPIENTYIHLSRTSKFTIQYFKEELIQCGYEDDYYENLETFCIVEKSISRM